jgi:hypothetical protein
MELTAIISLVSLAAKAAPEVEQVYQDGKTLIASLFSKGIITQAQQDAAMQWADAHQAAVLAGNTPPEFEVEP